MKSGVPAPFNTEMRPDWPGAHEGAAWTPASWSCGRNAGTRGRSRASASSSGTVCTPSHTGSFATPTLRTMRRSRRCCRSGRTSRSCVTRPVSRAGRTACLSGRATPRRRSPGVRRQPSCPSSRDLRPGRSRVDRGSRSTGARVPAAVRRSPRSRRAAPLPRFVRSRGRRQSRRPSRHGSIPTLLRDACVARGA